MPRFSIKTYSAPFGVWTAIPALIDCQGVAIANGHTSLGLRYRQDENDASTEGAQPLFPGAWLNISAEDIRRWRFKAGETVVYVQPAAAGTTTVEVHCLL